MMLESRIQILVGLGYQDCLPVSTARKKIQSTPYTLSSIYSVSLKSQANINLFNKYLISNYYALDIILSTEDRVVHTIKFYHHRAFIYSSPQ